MANEKIPYKHMCEPCNYITDNKKDYAKHLLTAKHIRLSDTNEKSQECCSYMCNSCGNSYKHAPSLCKHKKKCKGPGQDTSETTLPKPEEMMALMFKLMCDKLPDKSDQSQLVIELLKQNQDFKDVMMEQSKQLAEQNKQMMELANKAGNNTNCHNNTTNNNKFNLNVFLNETCKDAISMDDFINSIEVTRDEFIHTGQVGYIEGISTVMAHRFRDMEMHTRPLHCTDLKRETIYIKNADKWEKDDADKTNMRKAVRGIAKKNMKELWRWYNDNKPAVEQIGTDVCEDYFKFHKAALGGYGKEEDLKFEDKIMHNVLKEVQVDKSSALTL